MIGVILNHKKTSLLLGGFVSCRGRARTFTRQLAVVQMNRERYSQPTGGQPQSVRPSADRRYTTFILFARRSQSLGGLSSPPRQEGMSAGFTRRSLSEGGLN